MYEAPEKRDSKFAPKLLGPYKVLDQKRGRLFIENLASSEQKYWTSIGRVRRFLFDPLRPDPTSYAAADKGEYVVEEILGVLHQSLKKPLLFVTKWKGYGEEYNSNSTLAMVKDTDAFKTFLAKQKPALVKRIMSAIREVNSNRKGIDKVRQRAKGSKSKATTV